MIPSFPKLTAPTRTFIMADTKPVETAPIAEPVVETKPPGEAAETAPAVAEPEVAPVVTETVEEPAVAEEAKKDEGEVEKKPVEEGTLAHKGEGANFPKYVH